MASRRLAPQTRTDACAGFSTLPSSPLRLVSSTAKLEPGVFGIFRPALWLPAGIADRLNDAELEAVLAHELCHARRRDNLTAAVHMAVEAIFWFHPLVWWLGARLTEERERACDEEVVRMGGEPQVYAESILKVCEFYLASPVACAAGVTGGELKKRIEGIMTNRFTRELSYGKKMLLTVVAMLAVAGPIVISLTNPARSRAQSQTAPLPSFEVASVKVTATANIPRSRSGIAYGRETGGPGTNSPGQFTASYTTLWSLILKAYGLESYRLLGPPSLKGDKFGGSQYDIAAKIPPGATKEQFNLMLQDLLVRRFGLAVHWENRDLPVYELVVAKGGLKMKEAEKAPNGAAALAPPNPSAKPILDKDGFAVLPPGVQSMTYDSGPNGSVRVSARMTTVADLVGTVVRNEVDRPIIDKTGLAGAYDFNLFFVPERARVAGAGPTAAADPSSGQATLPDAASDIGPSIYVALERQLGLKLEPEKRPFSVLVVDKVNRTPTEN
jgi:bla regulator protein BlaR1